MNSVFNLCIKQRLATLYNLDVPQITQLLKPPGLVKVEVHKMESQLSS